MQQCSMAVASFVMMTKHCPHNGATEPNLISKIIQKTASDFFKSLMVVSGIEPNFLLLMKQTQEY